MYNFGYQNISRHTIVPHLKLFRRILQRKRPSWFCMNKTVRPVCVAHKLCERRPGTESLDSSRASSDSFNTSQLHLPVMKDEVIHIFSEAKSRMILDLTFGAGGHSGALLDALPGCHIIALDRDPHAHEIASRLASTRQGKVTPLLGKFSDVPRLFSEVGLQPGCIDGLLLDAGSSSMQFDNSERGFSLSKDGPLDMRMDGNRFSDEPSAADVVNSLDEADLAKIIKRYGEDNQASKIAHAIVQARSAYGRITTTKQLAQIVANSFPGFYGTDKLNRYKHPATKLFQALRIFVNNELNELNSALDIAHQYLQPGGICVAISFHSLEDRIIKRHFHDINIDEQKSLSLKQKMRSHSTILTLDELMQVSKKKWEPLFKKILLPTEDEVIANPRSRSAKLRAARRNEI